jgi:hypothetical protein
MRGPAKPGVRCLLKSAEIKFWKHLRLKLWSGRETERKETHYAVKSAVLHLDIEVLRASDGICILISLSFAVALGY